MIDALSTMTIEQTTVRAAAIVCVLAAGYLAVGYSAVLVARAARHRRYTARPIAVLGRGPARWVLSSALTPGLVLSLAGTPAAADTDSTKPSPTMQRSDPDGETLEVVTPPTMQRIGEPTTAPSRDHPPTSDEPPQASAGGVDDEWEVRPGDHLWSIAEETVSDHGGPGDLATVTRYWASLVEANRTRLVDPTNADLIHVGQRLALPPVEHR